jgi:hypothetical protein
MTADQIEPEFLELLSVIKHAAEWARRYTLSVQAGDTTPAFRATVGAAIYDYAAGVLADDLGRETTRKLAERADFISGRDPIIVTNHEVMHRVNKVRDAHIAEIRKSLGF